jgi:hypothetical protein
LNFSGKIKELPGGGVIDVIAFSLDNAITIAKNHLKKKLDMVDCVGFSLQFARVKSAEQDKITEEGVLDGEFTVYLT